MRTIKILVVLALFISISKASSQVVWPLGGATPEPWVVGMPAKVSWDKNIFHGLLKIKLWNGNTAEYNLVSDSVDALLGKFEFTIPETQLAGNKFRIRVEEIKDQGVYGMSESYFDILTMEDYMNQLQKNTPIRANTISEETKVLVTPNPANTTCQLSWKIQDAKELIVRNNLGQEIFKSELDVTKNGFELSVKEFPIGIYTAEILSVSGKSNIVKFIVNR